MKTFLKILAASVVLVLLVVVGIGVYIVRHPQDTWAVIEKHFLPNDLKVSWQVLDFQPGSLGDRNWKPFIVFENLCLKKQDPSLEFCLDRLEITSQLSLAKLLKPQLTILNLKASSKHLNYFRPSQTTEKKSEAELNFHEQALLWQKRLASYSKYLRVEAVDVVVEQFELRSNEGPPLLFQVSLQGLDVIEMAQIEIGIEKKSVLQIHLQGDLSLQRWMEAQGPVLQMRGDAIFSKVHLRLPEMRLEWLDKEKLQITANAIVKYAKMTFTGDLKALLHEKDFETNLNAVVQGLEKPFDHLKPIQATVHMPQEKGNLWPKEKTTFQARTQAPLFFVSAQRRAQVEKACKCEIPEELTASVSGYGFLKTYFDALDGELMEVQARVQNLNNSLFHTRIAADLKVLRQEKEFIFKPQINSQIDLNSFQGFALLMKEQKIAVPAPLSQLDGKISLNVQGPLDENDKHWSVPFNARVNLKSDQQRVDVTSTGQVALDLKTNLVDVVVDVLLKNIVLQLPPLDPMYGIPKIAPDRRFEIKQPQALQTKKSKYKLRLAIRVHTEQPDGIRLLHPLAKPSVPVGVDIRYQSGSPMTGQITLSSFGIEYLRRRSTIESLQMGLNQPVGNFPIKGRFRVDQSLYKIYVDILGNLKSPQIVLSSDPYLDRSDIISVLLYGRTNDQLVAADAKTVGSFDAAVADRAIGLFGLWALSSTPIQSFSYNQLSQQYMAQVRLSDDTSLSVGTNWEQAASLELQKRLSDRWMISASLEPTDHEQQTRKLRLQWEDRF